MIAAALNLFDFASLRWLWRCGAPSSSSAGRAPRRRRPRRARGIVVAIALSLAEFVRRAWRPYDAVLGRIRRKGYHDIDRHPEAAQIPGLVLYRFDAPLFFANAEFFVDVLDGDRRRATSRSPG